ncbi:MAG: NAD-dependent epimerase/dehydratase family protein [Candidatus Acidiferrales bacterium]
MKSYLITGGCGFIGVNLISRLVAEGASVRILDNLSLGKREDVDPLGVDLQVGDIRDLPAVAAACKGVDVVVHLAAHTRVVESVTSPELNFEINAIGTMNVLRACREAGVKKLIFASTGGAILGEQEPPVHEGMVPRPISPYGAGKLVGEAYCSAYCGAYGLNTVALRFSNVYGPYSYHKGSVVAQFFKNLIQKEPVVIYGDGRQTRDFLYVGDLVEAVLLADKTDTPGEVFQIASGRETSIQSLVSAMKEAIPGLAIEPRFEPPRAGEILRNYASIDKGRRILGYNPRMPLQEGLKKTWEWFLSRQGYFAARNPA